MKTTLCLLTALMLPSFSAAFADTIEDGMKVTVQNRIVFPANTTRQARDIGVERISPNSKFKCLLLVRDVLPRYQPYLEAGTKVKLKFLDQHLVALVNPDTGSEKARFRCSHENNNVFSPMEAKDIHVRAIENTLGLTEKIDEIQSYPINYQQNDDSAETSMEI
jgi:hypothetical protein